MSETVTHIGKLQKIEFPGVTDPEAVAKLILQLKGLTDKFRPEYFNGYCEWLLDDFHEEFIDVDGSWYMILENKELEGDIFQATKNEDGTVDFVVQYYNGGCCLSEALEEALKNLT